MKLVLQELMKRPFVRQVTTVATGAAASQAISFAFAPLLTRLYGPEAYGQQGVFLSLVTVIGVAAALSYPTAIVLPRQAAEARALVRLSVALGVGSTLLTAIVLLLAGHRLLPAVGMASIVDIAWLVPFGVLAAVLARVLAQWLIRQQAFRLTATAGALTTLFVNVAKVGGGLWAPQAVVLIAINTIGGLLGTVVTYAGWRRRAAPASADPTTAAMSLRAVATAYRDFPLLRTPQDLINTLSQSLPVVLLAASFGSAAAGHYTVAITLLGVPTALIGSSVMAVFYPRITAAVQGGEDAQALIVKTTLGMAATGALPFLAVIVAGPWLFGALFGPDWRMAGVYAQWLAPWLFLQYINQPAVAAIPALRLQRGLLVYELFSTGSKALALWLGFKVFGSDVVAVALFAGAGVLAYLWLIGWVVQRSRGTGPAASPEVQA